MGRDMESVGQARPLSISHSPALLRSPRALWRGFVDGRTPAHILGRCYNVIALDRCVSEWDNMYLWGVCFLMDAKDAIIFQQLDVIRSMTENNLRRIGDDFWGATPPVPRPSEKIESDKPSQPIRDSAVQSASAPEDEPSSETPTESIEDLKAELHSYIGLDNIKREVTNLINMTTVYQMRKSHDLPTVDMSLHMVFSGNPGTGKTMIARLMARIYKCLGVLSKGQLVEVDRSGLVAGFVGQTAIKVMEVVEKAKGGVLFIDEAYALTQRRGENDFGQEAVDTLLKAMEDLRDDLIVIVAGYDELMDGFIHSNPGLESRFNRFLHFPDYSLDEMCEIFEMQCKKGYFTLNDDAKQCVRAYIEFSDTCSVSFGNARGVRNLFEKILVQQANRLAGLAEVDRDMLMAITREDVLSAQAADNPDEPQIFEGVDELLTSLDGDSESESESEK